LGTLPNGDRTQSSSLRRWGLVLVCQILQDRAKGIANKEIASSGAAPFTL